MMINSNPNHHHHHHHHQYINNPNIIPNAGPTTLLTLPIPVIFYDGETQIQMGPIEITPTMNLKSLQSILSSKIGISPNQLTIYIDCPHLHSPRRPVTAKFDFGSPIIAHLNCPPPVSTGCHFWVVLKRRTRSHRSRSNNNNKKNGINFGRRVGPRDDVILLKRDVNDELVFLDYINKMRALEERHNYLMSLSLNSDVYDDLAGNCYYNDNGKGNYGMSVLSSMGSSGGGGDNFDDEMSSCCTTTTTITNNERVYCDVCDNFSSEEGNGEEVPFHWCKNDAIMNGFIRSPAGPIGPPSKSKMNK